MSESRLYIGPSLRRLRKEHQLTQAAMAEKLSISASYLNLLERNQRPLSARLMLGLAEQFDFNPSEIAHNRPGGGLGEMRKRLSDPVFAELSLDADEIEEWLLAAPNGAEAFAQLYDKGKHHATQPGAYKANPVDLVRSEIERWQNHFAELDDIAEKLADTLRLSGSDITPLIEDRLRSRHQLSTRIIPDEIMPGRLRRLDLHSRQLQLSEMLDNASRRFQLCTTLVELEYSDAIEDVIKGSRLQDDIALAFFRRHLLSYFAAALMMPYGRFLRACEQTGYDILVLQRRFGAGFEQVAHRLTTLQRVGARGLGFFMIRIDRAGQISKHFTGASQFPLTVDQIRCPLWQIHHSFAAPGQMMVQLISLENNSRWLTLSRTVQGAGFGTGGVSAQFAIGLGLSVDQAKTLCYARGLDLSIRGATRIGPSCMHCRRKSCTQRGHPPIGERLHFEAGQRGITPFEFG